MTWKIRTSHFPDKMNCSHRMWDLLGLPHLSPITYKQYFMQFAMHTVTHYSVRILEGV